MPSSCVRLVGQAGLQVLEAGDRVDPAQLDRGERVPVGAHRHQAGPDEVAGPPVDGVHDAVEQHLRHQGAAVRLDDLVDGPQRHLGDDLGVPAADLALVAGDRHQVVAHPVVAVLLDHRDHLDRRQVVLDQQVPLFRQVRQPEVLREVVRVDRVAEHHREVLDHRRRVRGRHRLGEPVHLGVVGCIFASYRRVLSSYACSRAANCRQPPRLGVHPAGAGVLVGLPCRHGLLLMQPLAAEDLADPARLRRQRSSPRTARATAGPAGPDRTAAPGPAS